MPMPDQDEESRNEKHYVMDLANRQKSYSQIPKEISRIIKTWSTHQIILQEKEKGFLELDFRKDNLHLNHKPWNRISYLSNLQGT